MGSQWQPFREPLRNTILRTGVVAIVVGFVLSRFWGGSARWPMATLLVLWLSFGGHWVELWFLNFLRPRLSASRGLQATARLVVWFVGGTGLAACMALTAGPGRWPAWWVGGLAFIGIELVIHLALQLRGRPSFYNGRG